MEMLKTLWYIRKIKVYESLIIKMTKLREGIKTKQLKFTERQEYYTNLVKDSGSKEALNKLGK